MPFHCALGSVIYVSCPQVLPYLEKVDSLVLWLGGDLREYVAAKQFARKLGESRCSVIRPGTHTPGALAASKGGGDLGAILGAAREVKHKCIVSFSTLRHEVKAEMEQADHVAGVKVGVL
jgi:twinkle protein